MLHIMVVCPLRSAPVLCCPGTTSMTCHICRSVMPEYLWHRSGRFWHKPGPHSQPSSNRKGHAAASPHTPQRARSWRHPQRDSVTVSSCPRLFERLPTPIYCRLRISRSLKLPLPRAWPRAFSSSAPARLCGVRLQPCAAPWDPRCIDGGLDVHARAHTDEHPRVLGSEAPTAW